MESCADFFAFSYRISIGARHKAPRTIAIYRLYKQQQQIQRFAPQLVAAPHTTVTCLWASPALRTAARLLSRSQLRCAAIRARQLAEAHAASAKMAAAHYRRLCCAHSANAHAVQINAKAKQLADSKADNARLTRFSPVDCVWQASS